jgi:hypothetical protein
MDNVNHFKLVFYHRGKRKWVLAADYLEQHQKGISDWVPDIEYMGLSLVVDGKEWILEYRSVGRYPDLIPQLDATAARLRAGKEALLRTAVEDVPEGIYFLFEPKTEEVLISLLYLYDEKVFIQYPIPDPSPSAAELYAYVNAHKKSLLSPEAAFGYRFIRLPFPKTTLIEDLEREAAVGREILALSHFANRDE